jgi:hypothetical protein
MSTSVSGLSTNFFPSAQNGFTTSLASTIASAAATVPLNSVAGYTNGEIAVMVVDPTDASKKQTFTGVVDTGGIQLTSVKWTAGTNQTHTGGSTVVDYATATHISMMTKGITTSLSQDGTLKTSAVQTALSLGASALNGWVALGYAPNTVTGLGNRSYSLVFNSVDLTSTLSAGMRLRTTRTVAAPTQCTSLNGTTQYYSKAAPNGMTFTDDFTVSAWVKLSSYATTTLVSRYNGTSGWSLNIDPTGQVFLIGYNAGAANFSYVGSYQSLPLNKWVHIAAQLDMSTFTATTTTSYIMIDGVDVPASVTRGGTNPTALIQAGSLEIGSRNGGTNFFGGKIAQVAIYSAKVTQATILASMNQTLAGTETNLISAYSFNNSINDLNANANNLTANGSAVATNADSPFGGQADGTISSTLDYAIIQKTAFSTNTTVTVQIPEGCTIPTSGGVTSVVYSANKTPYLMPVQRGKWRVSRLDKTTTTSASNATYGSFNSAGCALVVPLGEWNVGWKTGAIFNTSTTAVWFAMSNSALTGLTSTAGGNVTNLVSRITSAAASATVSASYIDDYYSLSAASTFIMYTLGATTAAGIAAADAPFEMFADNSYL